MNIYALVFYGIISPLLFTYGIGLERLCIMSANRAKKSHFYIKNFVFVFLASSFAYVVFHFVLSPIYLGFSFPVLLIIFLFFLEKGLFYLYDSFISNSYTLAHNERLFTFGTVIVSLYESSSYMELVFIVFMSFIDFIVFTILFRSIRKKIDSFNIETKWRSLPLLLISLGIIATALYFVDIYFA